MALRGEQQLTLVPISNDGPLVPIALTPEQPTILGRQNAKHHGVPAQLLAFISHQHVQLDVTDRDTAFVAASSSLQDQKQLIPIGGRILKTGVRSPLLVGDGVTFLVRGFSERLHRAVWYVSICEFLRKAFLLCCDLIFASHSSLTGACSMELR